MPWCPKCKTEYRQGFKTCSDCKSELVEELEQIMKNEIYDYDREIYLTSAANSVEAEMIEALLNSNGIPVLKKFREAGDYLKIYMGGTNLGVDLYVPSKLFEKAKDIIDGTQELAIEESRQDSDEEEIIKLDRNYSKKRRIRTWIILLFFIPGFLWAIAALIYNLYHWKW